MKIRNEHYHERIGRGYRVVVLDAMNPKDGMGEQQYDIELAYNGRYVCALHTNCYGEKSAKYWYDVAIKQMRRLIFLLDGYDMARHNKMCYSKNILAKEPKEDYNMEWHIESMKIKLVDEWIDEVISYYGKESEQYIALKSEFVDKWR